MFPITTPAEPRIASDIRDAITETKFVGYLRSLRASEILFGPLGGIQHPMKCLDDEGVGELVVGDRDGAAVGVFVPLVAAFNSRFAETVIFKSSDEHARVHS